jgi:hypothetical protein
MLRCKENDLAVLLKGPYTGYLVTVGKYLGTVSGITPYGKLITVDRVWEVSGEGVNPHYDANRPAIQDHQMQPIRSGNVTIKKEVSA